MFPSPHLNLHYEEGFDTLICLASIFLWNDGVQEPELMHLFDVLPRILSRLVIVLLGPHELFMGELTGKLLDLQLIISQKEVEAITF